MTDYLNSTEAIEPEIEMSQDFLYRELRNKHPELSKVSKREYANNKELQEKLEGFRLDGTTWRDDYEFDETLNTNVKLKENFTNEKEGLPFEKIENEFSYGGDTKASSGNRLTEFNGGGRHEENSLGGIPIGLGSNGKMNTVEEGETMYEFDDGGYVFSNRIDTSGLFKDAIQAKKELKHKKK